MNAFEFLGLPADHRKEGKVVQLVKHMDEVPPSKITYPLIGQVKKDGVYCMVISTDYGCEAFGRTGRKLNNVQPILDEFMGRGVFIGELCCDGISLEELSGAVNPNRVEPLGDRLQNSMECGAYLALHDYLTTDEFIAGESVLPYMDRLHNQPCIFYSDRIKHLPFDLIRDGDTAEEFARKQIDAGEEGAVFKQSLGWLAGHKGHRSMKRVRRVTYDLACIGAEEGKGKRQGMVANLVFRWRDGQTIKADMGKNWSDAERINMWRGYQCLVGDSTPSPKGLNFKVYGLQDSSKGKIRLPKVGELRHDKAEADF